MACQLPFHTLVYRLKMMHLHAIYIIKGSSLKGVSANNHSRFDLPCEGAKNTDGWLHALA